MIYQKVFPNEPDPEPREWKEKEPIIFEKRGGRSTMKVVNITEFNDVIEAKKKDLNSSYQLYRHEQPEAAEVAKWGMDLLDEIKEKVNTITFEATINQYKSRRNGV